MTSGAIKRVLLANLGLDGHQMGALVVARGLTEAGFEVIYLGLNQMPEEIAWAAVEEDVDVVGISSMCGIHLEALPEVVSLLGKHGCKNLKVLAGGIIPEEDVPALKAAGIAAVFGPGSRVADIVACVRECAGVAE